MALAAMPKLDIENVVNEAIDEALQLYGCARLVDQPYADELVNATVRALRDDDQTLQAAARSAVQYWREYLELAHAGKVVERDTDEEAFQHRLGAASRDLAEHGVVFTTDPKLARALKEAYPEAHVRQSAEFGFRVDLVVAGR